MKTILIAGSVYICIIALVLIWGEWRSRKTAQSKQDKKAGGDKPPMHENVICPHCSWDSGAADPVGDVKRAIDNRGNISLPILPMIGKTALERYHQYTAGLMRKRNLNEDEIKLLIEQDKENWEIIDI